MCFIIMNIHQMIPNRLGVKVVDLEQQWRYAIPAN